MNKAIAKLLKLILLGGMFFGAINSFAAPKIEPPEKNPIEILKHYNATKDTTGLNHCLIYVNENFEKNSNLALVNELLVASKIAEKLDHHHISAIYSILKKYYESVNNKSKSFEYSLKIYKLLSKTHHETDLLWILVDIGNIFYSEQDYEYAKIFYRRAERIAKKGTDRYPLSVIYMNYGLIEDELKNYRKALNHYKISCIYRAKSENVKIISSTYIKIANTYLKLQKPDSCLHYIRLAEDYYYNKGEETGILIDMPDYINYSYAEYYAFFGNYEKALFHIDIAKKYCLENNLLEEYIQNVEMESNFYSIQKRYPEAIDCISKLLPILKENQMLTEQKMAYKKLGEFYAQTGEFEKADAAMKKYIQIDDSIDFTTLKSQLTMVRSISAVYESDEVIQQTKKNLELAKLNNKLSTRKRNTSIAITGISVLIIVILLVLYKSLRRNRRRLILLRDKLISQNHEISKNSTELEATNQLKDKLFSIIAHDLRNPLNRMLVELAIVKKSEPENYQTSQIERTLKETIELFEGLLQWSKLDNKQNVYSPLKINLNDSINKVLALLAPEINSMEISITTKTKSLYIFADQNIIQTLLRNLISNGIIFANKNEKDKAFEIEMYEIENNKIEMIVSNSGPKFTDETMAEFYNKDEHIISGHINLGLSICKLLAKMCSWKIEIQNHQDREGVFMTIQIPQFLDKKRSIRKILDPSFQLPLSFTVHVSRLKEYKFYQTSQIRTFIKSLGEIQAEDVKIWIENIEEAVDKGDEATYIKLIQLIDQNNRKFDVN